MAKYLLLRNWLVFLKTSSRRGLPIFLKVNHRLESRMQEICQSGSEGGAKHTFVPTPIIAQASAWVNAGLRQGCQNRRGLGCSDHFNGDSVDRCAASRTG